MKSKKNQFINGFLCMVCALSISNVFAQQSIEEVVVAEEKVIFKLPKELN